MRKRGWKKLVPEWRCNPHNTHTSASNTQPRQGARTRREGRLSSGWTLLAFQARRRPQSPPMGMKPAAAFLKRPSSSTPLREHKERRLQTQSVSDLFYIFRSVHSPYDAFTAMLGVWAPTSFLCVRERTEKVDFKVLLGLMEGFFLPSTMHNPSRMARGKGHYVENLSVCFQSRVPYSTSFFMPRTAELASRPLPNWPKTAHMGSRPNSKVDNLLCASFKINMKPSGWAQSKQPQWGTVWVVDSAEVWLCLHRSVYFHSNDSQVKRNIKVKTRS